MRLLDEYSQPNAMGFMTNSIRVGPQSNLLNLGTVLFATMCLLVEVFESISLGVFLFYQRDHKCFEIKTYDTTALTGFLLFFYNY